MNIETANRLVELRRQRGLSQEELSDQLGVSRQAVSKWERAESSPDTDNLIALARLYGISLDELLLHTPNSGYAYAQANEEDEVFGTADVFDAAMEEQQQAQWKKRRKFLLAFPFPVLVTMVFLAIGFLFGWWHPGWMVFLTIPIYYCVVSAL